MVEHIEKIADQTGYKKGWLLQNLVKSLAYKVITDITPADIHRAAITDEAGVGRLYVSICEYDGGPTLTAALKLMLLTMCRPGEVRHMKRSGLRRRQ